MSTFTTLRDRDAWNTIRGYVYQVDLTIERWLNLQPGQTLELECGEDIDIVSRSLTAIPAERQRLLEQVKHRDSSITLRTPEAVTAIACFVEHRQINRGVNLLFRFTTNTKIGKERPSPIPKKTSAIEAWEQIRNGSLQGREQESVLQGIHTILKNVKQPDKVDDDTWQKFRNFITTATNSQLLDLICSFEWSANAPEAKSLSPSIQKLLAERKHAINNIEAQEQYRRLFLYVFKRLTERERKQLTVEERSHQLSLSTLSESDHQLLNKLWVWVQALESRVGTLEQGLSQTNEVISLMNAEVQRLAREQGVDASIKYTVATPILDIPPIVECFSPREETVNTLTEIFISHDWTAIHGSLGSGKTQLAGLLIQKLTAEKLSTCSAWVRLRDLTTEQACIRLDAACEALVASPPQNNRYEWYCQLCERLGDKAMLVLDDLPRLSKNDELSERLIQLVKASSLHGVRLLSTSPYPLPTSFQSLLGEQLLHTMLSPPFGTREAAEIFQAYSAPDSFLAPERVSYINGLARQHPSLLVAIAQYLLQQDWRFSAQTLEELFKGEHTAELNDETVDKILTTIQDSQSQELLYRLNLIINDFSLEDLQAVAFVEPIVERPRQRLNTLIGLWIQRDVNNRLLVSPLVKALGSNDLSLETRRKCHLTLGEQIVQKHKFDQYDAINALVHFCSAEAFTKAGTILMLALHKLESMDGLVDDGGLLSVWCDQSLPEQIDLGIRLYMRGLQIAVRHKYGKRTSYLVNDLDVLLRQASEKEAWVIPGVVAMMISKCLELVGLIRANRYLLTALRFLPQARLPDGSELVFPNELQFEYLLWVNVKGITTVNHLRDWFSTVEQLTPEQRQRAFSAKPAEPGCFLIFNDLYYAEKDKPREQQQWHILLDALQELADRALQHELKLLWACAVRVQIAVLGTHLQNLDGAVVSAEAVFSQSPDAPYIKLLIGECMGRQYVNAKRNSEALTWLNQALSQGTTSYPAVQLDALVLAIRAVAPENPRVALQYIRQAVSLAEGSEAISENILVKTLGELAIAQWLTSGLSAAFEPWERAGERLFACKADTDGWKELLMVYGHVSGYFTYLARFGSAPITVSDGSPYHTPERGIFFNHYSGIAANYDKSRESLLAAQLAEFAEAIGNDERAAAWALKGMDMARQANQRLAFPALSMNAIPHLLLDNRYAEVLELAVEAGAILVAVFQYGQAGGNPLDSNLDVEGVLGSKPNEMWQQAERNALIVGLLPIAFRLGTIAIRQPDLARIQAADVAAICREISEISGKQTLWAVAAGLVQQIYLQETSCQELIRHCQTFNSQDNVLQAIGYIAATLQESATLAETLAVHFAVMPLVYDLFKPNSTIYRRVVLPFVATYWKTALEQVQFRFRSPQLLSQLLFQAQSLPEEQQAQLILGTVGYGLGVSPPPEAAQWLRRQFLELPI